MKDRIKKNPHIIVKSTHSLLLSESKLKLKIKKREFKWVTLYCTIGVDSGSRT